MESEERPAKRLKLGNGEEVEIAAFADTPVDLTSGTEKIAVTDEQSPANNGSEQKIETHNRTAPENSDGEDGAPKLSKNQLKKQRRIEKWEAGREDRKVKRREKLKAKRHRKRDEWAQNHPSEDEDEDEDRDADTATSTANGTGMIKAPKTKKVPNTRPPKYPDGTQLPVTFLFDCDFNDLMYESELKSLGVQITRSYSDNRKSQFHVHMAMSSFGGKLQERFDGILAKQYTSWKNFPFFSENFVQVSEKAKVWMKGEQGGVIAGALNQEDGEEGEVVYLSAESDVTLERLKPNSTYIIGGLVDKNRHKGICYKRAMDRGVKTAKLPIGEFLQMKSRKVLATNHVIEIMLKWLECGDWGKAFLEVIPARKGGVLKTEVQVGSQQEEEEEEEEESGDEDDSEKDVVVDEENGVTVGGQAMIEEGFIAAAKPNHNALSLAKGIAEELDQKV